jgi:hypothetical protein
MFSRLKLIVAPVFGKFVCIIIKISLLSENLSKNTIIDSTMKLKIRKNEEYGKNLGSSS